MSKNFALVNISAKYKIKKQTSEINTPRFHNVKQARQVGLSITIESSPIVSVRYHKTSGYHFSVLKNVYKLYIH